MRYASEDLSIFVTPMFIHREVSFGVVGDYSPAKKYIASYILGENRLLDGSMNNAIINGETPLRDEIGSFDFIEVSKHCYKASTGRIQSLSTYLPLFEGPQCIGGKFSNMELIHLITDLLAFRTALVSLEEDAQDEINAISNLTSFICELYESEPMSDGYFYKDFRGASAYYELVGLFLRTIAYFGVEVLFNIEKIEEYWDLILGASAYDPQTKHKPEPLIKGEGTELSSTVPIGKRRKSKLREEDSRQVTQNFGQTAITFKYKGFETWDSLVVSPEESPPIISLDEVKKVAPEFVGKRKPSDISEKARKQAELEKARKLQSFKNHYTGIEDDFDRGLDY
ncbi:hypothetical protein [Morchella esculenta fusarivirus 2]|uniref:Uncharacterized protein n=1 Tax=Morchella esculenta fusarivirus 2 TaxID=2830907 RepID=A0AAE7RIL4_9VIRU|nr:hypothetical protein [Morchella esculenta fusarivirus 2]